MKHFIFAGLACVSVLGFVIGCGNDATTTTTGAATLADLPKATGTTTASAAATIQRGNELQSATTGVELDSWYTAFNGATAKSQTFCQFGLMVKDVVRAASQPDKIACYLGVMEKYSTVSGWPSNGSDGNYHYVTLTNAGGGDGKIKFKVTKTGSIITGMEMFSGFGGSAQTEYISMSMSGGTITLTSVQYYNGNGQTNLGRVTVTGTINSSGTWTSAKTVVAESSRTETTPSRSENTRVDLTQYADRFVVQGYRTGTDNGAAFTDQVYSLVQFLNPIPLGSLALGEGTAKMSMTHATFGSFAQTRAWNGDTGLPISPASTADYFATVTAATLPSAPASYNTSFAAAEQWDLLTPSGETASTVDFNNISADASAAAEFNACNTNYGFTEESGWPNCWSLSDN